MSLLEQQRLLHEDLERLEDAIADRLREDPNHIRDRLARDHDVAQMLQQIETQSDRLYKIYKDVDGERAREIRNLSTGDPMESFQREVAAINDFHRRYPNEPVENLETVYKKRTPEDVNATLAHIDAMFTGEEGFGRYFDLIQLHEQYLNLPGQQQARRPTYLQYLDIFDVFIPPQCVLRRDQKLSEPYFKYLKALLDYLESFHRRTKPLENIDVLYANFGKEFGELWEKGEVPGWENAPQPATAAPVASAPGDGDGGIWCSFCKRSFATETVYGGHLSGRKHKRAVKYTAPNSASNASALQNDTPSTQRFKERAVAEKEFRIRKIAAAMQTERSDTKVNVERKQGMTERERQQELEALFSEAPDAANGGKDEGHASDEDKIYNPLKLPLDWSGKPIPFWLWKLHGLGVEFPCQICGNYVYMGRRAFDKHFNEPRHVWGLKALGITSTSLFREITGIKEAENLWAQIQQQKRKNKSKLDNVVQMEDHDGNVMPEKIYKDLLAQGIL